MHRAAESGLSRREFGEMTWGEYTWHDIGYQRRVERQLDNTRHLIAGMFNSSGFAKRKVDASEVMQLPLLDTPRKVTAEKMDMATIERLLRLSNTDGTFNN